MSRPSVTILAAALALIGGAAKAQETTEAAHEIAFASFAPLDTDLYIANADGAAARLLLGGPEFDYNPVISPDGQWVFFTSDRSGSADIYRIRLDGSDLQRLTDDPAFDDQASLSPDGGRLAFVSDRGGFADIWVIELDTGAATNVTHSDAGDFRPSWSPDGQWLAFSSDEDSPRTKFNFVTLHSTALYLVRPDGSGRRRVTEAGAFAGSPSWSPDGRTLIYYACDLDNVNKVTSPRRLRGTTQIMSVDVETGVLTALTNTAGEKWSPHRLPDGAVGYVSGGPEGGLEFLGRDPGARGEIRSPGWSSDGSIMVFHREVGTAWPPFQRWRSPEAEFALLRTGIFPTYGLDGDRIALNDQTAGILHNSIVAMEPDGSGQFVLFNDPERSALAPAVSPQGDRIAFGLGGFFQATMGSARADIATIRSDGSGLEILTDGSGNFGFPSWSPDGRRIVYRGSSAGRGGLFILDTETRVVAPVIGSEGHDNFPSWSPDGERISFTSDRDGDYEIYTVRTDGSDLVRLTHSPGNEAHNAWSPDGEWIVFTSAVGGFKDEAVLHPFNPQPYGDLYVMRSNGSDVRRLTNNQFEEGTPSWAVR